MYIYMGHMKFEHTKPYEDWFWEKNRINLKRAYVTKIHSESNSILLDSGEELNYDDLIIATGSKPNKFGWSGQDLKGVQGLYSYQDLESMEQDTKGIKHAVVVGGGLIGIEMVEMLLSRQIPVTFVARESSFWNGLLPPEESDMINNHIRSHHVDFRLSTELKEIVSDETGRAKSVKLSDGTEVECQFVGLTVGVHPNIDLVKDSGIDLKSGILVDEYLCSNVKNVYALGDCAQLLHPTVNRRPIEPIWYTGKIMGETVAATICGKPTKYNPGIWYNSAKFMDIEYQNYGVVTAVLENGFSSFYWECKSRKRALRIVYDSDSKEVVGFNILGIRMKHESCVGWIKSKALLDEVVADLSKANFNPEFFQKFEKEVQKQFNTIKA